MDEQLLDRLVDRYPQVAKDLLNPLIELLRLSRLVCGGDVDKFLVVMTVGVRAAEHREFARSTASQLDNADVLDFPGLGTNVRSISEAVGIPKETVRRKVAELIGAGWLQRRGQSLFLTAAGYRDLAPVRSGVTRLAMRNHEIVCLLGTSSGG